MYGFYISPKACSDCNIASLRTRRWCFFYVNPNVTLEDTRLIKIVGTHGTVKMLIFSVNLIVTLNSNRSRESLFTYIETKVIKLLNKLKTIVQNKNICAETT